MALVCPVGHPPGVGTSFCRLCGRDYVEETPIATMVSLEQRLTLPVPPPPDRSAPVHVVEPPEALLPPSPEMELPGPVPLPEPPPPPPVVAPPPSVVVPPAASHMTMQVHLPLIAMEPEPSAGESEAGPEQVPPPEPVLEIEAADEPEPETVAEPEAAAAVVPGRVVRLALLGGLLGGFVGGGAGAALVTWLMR